MVLRTRSLFRGHSRSLAADLITLAGLAAVVVGVWRIYQPAALILAGLFALAFAFAMSRATL